VYGLWHLGCVTAACLAEAGQEVVALDPDPERAGELRAGRPPVQEPGLAELIAAGLASGRLSFPSDRRAALAGVEVLWVTLDTPVDESDQADVAGVRREIEELAGLVPEGTLVLVSSQVPAGFTRALSRDWAGHGLLFGYSPENLQLGRALEAFRKPERIVVGVADDAGRRRVEELMGPIAARIEWMGLESAEMTKHALNAFLATSIAFANEVARACECVGADAREVERGLKSDRRIGPGAYLAPGPAFAGGTLARDVRYLIGFGERHGNATPLLQGVLESNAAHARLQREELRGLLPGADPVAAILGLAYKPGTSTLRRSSSLELCRWLQAQGVSVRAHDPAVEALPEDLASSVRLCASARDALAGADVAFVATPWPEYRALRAEDFVSGMRRPCVVDPGRLLEAALSDDARILYRAIGRPREPRA
jgi:UDPglucose 6-dehydrogenase